MAYETIIPNDETLAFISDNADADVRQLALRGSRNPSVDMPFALDQIAGRQTARRKLPAWAAVDGIIYPPHLSMEQCSSEATAIYKRGVLDRLIEDGKGTFIDITGGFGVDFSYLAQGFGKATYVERQEHLCRIARHNFSVLGLTQAQVINADGEEYIRSIDKADILYIDPARRDTAGKRTYAIADCTPDILGFICDILPKVKYVIVKLSPMLDWHSVITDINRAAGHEAVSEVHIISVANECKELLIVVSPSSLSGERIFCVNDGNVFAYGNGEDSLSAEQPSVGEPNYLLVPDASVMKAGCFRLLQQRFPVNQISPNSHLFTSSGPVDGFPGRQFTIECVTTMNKKELRHCLEGIAKANIAVRNFPLTADQLRKRLKLKDGGEHYIFATTNAGGEHVLYLCTKA